MKKIITLLVCSFSLFSFAQVRGTLVDQAGIPISYATVILEQTQQGVISNDKGEYEILPKSTGNATLVFQFLGYKTERKSVQYDGRPLTLNIVLQEEEFQLDDIVINVGKNPADEIIRRAIANKAKNTQGVASFTADFYSKGMIKSLKIPKFVQDKVYVGQDKANGLDSLGQGILYLSETVSQLKYQKPNQLKEHIIASKVSGNNNGYSFNTADESMYDFYDNQFRVADFDLQLISPLANQAFSFYRFNLEATFKDNGVLINKIKVTPKVKNQPVFYGDIYIVDDSAALYGVDLTVTGISLQQPFLESITISQNFFYNQANNTWVKRSQTLDILISLFGFKGQGVFLSVFNNYDFAPNFTRADFGKEVLSFAKDANKKEDEFWINHRLYPLTAEEAQDYHFKDSIRERKESPAYRDSLRVVYNKFTLTSPLLGYNYKSKEERFRFAYDGLINLETIGFNTVQGFYMGSGVSAQFYGKDKISYTSAKASFDYGFASERFRAYGTLSHRLNDLHQSLMYVRGGTKIKQFHPDNISEQFNSLFSLLFRKNFAKYYNNEEVYVGYNGKFFDQAVSLGTELGYEQRKPLFNNANGSFYTGSRAYTSNDPTAPLNALSAPIELHHLYKFKLGLTLNLGMKYVSYPDKRWYIPNTTYPKINIGYEKAFSGNLKGYNYDLVVAGVKQDLSFSNKGELSYHIKGGHFFDGDDISYVDRKHFSGNQTHLTIENDRMSSFNLLPYYSLSTNKSYVETHLEYNFKGFIMNRLPLLKWTGWNVVAGYHNATTSDMKAYQEFTVGLSNIGIRSMKGFRVDYVRAYQGSAFFKDGLLFGFKKDF
ncbi:carboxypeptidase-like regulatory domain-containing protein [Myroides sp. NP-2]|uniref:DUF5686 and carboxypeptidase regulatory-like domain-containing protein n=1 Tax=Myroides sp. NP-2 TaxID=2759945 RepID=UPI0015F8896F|nr:DUF5686 and carboxypeptidase regulatory-like domain-containing protein [Myroides sp. NP-2]MBB1150952.1 carboxypeptidase-like regulatory domain-containing protein [Myroides sp. NP-2]